MNRAQRWLHRVDEIQQRHLWTAFPSAVIRKFGDDRAGGLAALVAYYGFFSIFPLLLVVVTVASFVLHGDEALQLRIVDSALAQFPVIGTQIRDNVGSISGSVFALAVGIGGALWAGMAVLTSLQNAMDEVWDVPRRERSALPVRVLRGAIVLVTLGVVVLTAAIVAGVAAAIGTAVAVVGGTLISVILNVVTMLVVFRTLTAAPVSWRDVLPGAILAGLVWTGLQAFGGYLIDRRISGAGDTYGVFAVVIGLLSWLYLGAQLTVVAAEVNVVLRRRLWPRSLFAPPTGPQDERALATQAKQEEAVATERVSVDFEHGANGRPRVEDPRSG